MAFQSSTPPPQAPPQPTPIPKSPQEPFMVQVSQPPPERESVKDVIVGAFGLTGALVLAAVLSGSVLAGLWIVWRKWRRTYDSDAPPSLGSVPISPTRPPSSQDQ